MTTALRSPLFGIDAAQHVSEGVAHGAGAHFVCRYVSRSTWKVLSRSELEALDAHGIGVVVVFEDGAKNSLAGHAQGMSDAEFARRQASALGFPSNRPIYFAVDFDTAGNPGATDAYFDGVAQVLGHGSSGPYGGLEVVTHQLNRGFQWAWQTYAWSRGFRDGRSKIMQYSNDHTLWGVGCDFDHAYFVDYGQSNYHAAPPKPPDPYAIFPSFVGDKSLPNKGDERRTIQQADGALKEPGKYKGYLKGKVYYELRTYRDRIARVSLYAPPHFTVKRKHADWGNNRGPRYQLINSRMERIAKL